MKGDIDPLNFVRMEGLEPPCPEALDPKSSASTNFATSAKRIAKVFFYLIFTQLLYVFFQKNIVLTIQLEFIYLIYAGYR